LPGSVIAEAYRSFAATRRSVTAPVRMAPSDAVAADAEVVMVTTLLVTADPVLR
jgi:hypothetical protein